MEHPYYELLYLVFNSQPCTRFKLEHWQRGKFKNQIDECIKQSYITTNGKNADGYTLYYITTKGKEIID